MMKIKKLLLPTLLAPLVFITLISGDCDFLNDGEEKTSVKIHFKPRDIGWHEMCGGSLTGSQTIQWNYTNIVYKIDDNGKRTEWRKSTWEDVHGNTVPQWGFIDVPSTGKYQVEMIAVSTRCYRTAPSAPSCQSRCARFQRIETTQVYDGVYSDIYITNDDVLWGPCC